MYTNQSFSHGAFVVQIFVHCKCMHAFHSRTPDDGTMISCAFEDDRQQPGCDSIGQKVPGALVPFTLGAHNLSVSLTAVLTRCEYFNET